MRLHKLFLATFSLFFIPLAQGGTPLWANCEAFFSQTPPLSESFHHFSPQELANQITQRRARVPEFQFIANLAKQRGLRAWLFGGTAASYCHYVKWDLLREYGDRRFQPERFDYDYTNIYRSTQDLDIVIDGSDEQARNFESELKAQFPYFSGENSTPWEVRSLKESSQDKGGILDDFGFMNQNTDSNSTGMVELTDPPRGEAVIRDLRDWKNQKKPQFLEDLSRGTLTYYESPRHLETPRAQAGKNPPIFGVIRALTKAFQFDLKINPSDFQIFKQTINSFDPLIDLKDPYAANWIEKNGKKLFQNAVNLEYAWNTLESLGLRRKLINIRFNPKTAESLSWWLNKEPLRSQPIGQGEGQTAESLGLKNVAHETSHFLAYESITRSHSGTPNVFVSRINVASETAMYGEGFYTAVGKQGAAHTGITVRFEVDPRAREGSDFIRGYNETMKPDRVHEGDFIIWKNKNALRVIPESIHLTPLEYFQQLEKGTQFQRKDRAILWKFRRKLQQKIVSGQISFEESERIRKIVETHLLNDRISHQTILSEWIHFEGLRLKIPDSQLDEWAQLWAKQGFLVNPLPLFTAFTRLSKGTGLEHSISHDWLARISKQLKTDVGERVIEECLFSDISEVHHFGVRALNEQKALRKSYFLNAIDKIYLSHQDPTNWLKAASSDSEEILEKAAYLALHPELRTVLSEQQTEIIQPTLKNFTFLPIFENYLQSPLPTPIKSESFNFVSYDLPSDGVEVTLGSPSYEEGRWYGREDLHDVVLTKSFQIQATPVTQLQWAIIMGDNPSFFYKNGPVIHIHGRHLQLNPNLPVDYISWTDAQIFIDRLNLIDPDFHYRLPTEAEWEFAARAGTKTPFSHGKPISDLDFYAWTSENSGGIPHEVASLKPNPNGLYDMHGNVWEWVNDWWSETRPTFSVDPQGPLTGKDRILRGGSCANQPRESRSARRLPYHPEDQRNFAGLRLVRTPKKQAPLPK